MSMGIPDWLRSGQGVLPNQRWSFAVDARLSDLRVARESGQILAADESGGLYFLDRRGRVTKMTRTAHSIPLVGLCDTGRFATAIFDRQTLAWLDATLQVKWTRELPDEVVGLAMDLHGAHVIVSMVTGRNIVYNADKRKQVEFESLRPLRFIQFLADTQAIVAAADYGFLARFRFRSGEPEWTERLWSTVSDLSATGDGQSIQLAGLAHGLQIFDGEGSAQGSFVLDGTANLVTCTYARKRLAAATLERQLLLLDGDGQLKWLVDAPDDVRRIALAPLGNWMIVGFAGGRIIRLDCG